MFDDSEVIDGSNFNFGNDVDFDPLKELKASEEDILAELGKIDTGMREELPPALQKIYDMRELDPYYYYVNNYKSDFLNSKKKEIMKYQVFNEETQFYIDDADKWNQKLKTGLANDILEMYIEKILTTKLRVFNLDNKEVEKDLINPIALETIALGLCKYETCLVIADDIYIEEDVLIENGDIIGSSIIGKSLNTVRVYPPHMYDLEEEVIILKNSNGQIETKSFADKKHVELKGQSVLYKKRELVYLASLFVTNFGIEGETGKMKIHVDERYGEGLSKDVYSVYDSIQSGGAKDFDPLWKMTQGDIRPSSWKTSLETVLYLISRSVGVDIRGTVYSTATQADISNLDNVVKINAKLTRLAYSINKAIRDLLGIEDMYVKFDTFSHDNLDQKLTRLETAYNMGGLLVEDYMRELYSLLNLKEPTKEQITKLKVERGVALTQEEVLAGVDASSLGLEGE